MSSVISRKDAHLAGLRRFFTGIPCKNGHVAERYVGNGACIGCMNTQFKLRKNAYSHELAPYTAQRLWIPVAIGTEDTQALEKYLQRCIFEYARATGKMTPELEAAAEAQLGRM